MKFSEEKKVFVIPKVYFNLKLTFNFIKGVGGKMNFLKKVILFVFIGLIFFFSISSRIKFFGGVSSPRMLRDIISLIIVVPVVVYIYYLIKKYKY